MKKVAMLVVLAACELQPAPPPPPAPAAGSAQPVATGSAAQPVATGSGSAAAPVPRPVAPPPIEATPECEQAGIKLADLMVAGAEESQKPAFERDRANIVRRTEAACTQQHWVPASLSCIAQSKNDRDARACLEKFPPPAVQAAAEGSAASKPKTPSPAAHGPSGPSGSVPVTEQQIHAGSAVRVPEPHGSAATH
jgi:hypothetical protein